MDTYISHTSSGPKIIAWRANPKTNAYWSYLVRKVTNRKESYLWRQEIIYLSTHLLLTIVVSGILYKRELGL